MADRTCTIANCERPRGARGLCSGHYYRWQNGMDLNAPIRVKRPSGMSPAEAFCFVMPEDPPGPDACWVWRGTPGKGGYGTICYDRAHYPAHRTSYELFVGEIPAGLYICHHCDNPPCVNPAHLYPGTDADNNRDRVLRGRTTRGSRGLRGESHPRARLTNADAEAIRIHYSRGGITMQGLGDEYGVNKQQIYRIVREKSYPKPA